MNTNPSASTALLGADLSDGPKSSFSSFDATSGIAPSFVSTALSEVSNDGGNARLNLRSNIRKASKRCIEWIHPSPQDTFLPKDEILNLIRAETIREQLAEDGYPKDLVSHIVPHRMKLVAILTIIGMGDSTFKLIEELVEEGIDDSYLPFSEHEDPEIGSLSYSVKGDTGADKTYEIQTFTPFSDKDSCWDSHKSGSFCKAQWKVLAPHFDMLCPRHDGCSTTKELPQHKFGPQEILPFTKPNEKWEPFEQSGGCSVVSKVFIHPAHRSHCRLECRDLTSPEVNYAVKSINRSCSPSIIQREINNLKRFDGKKHRDRLVKLLYTFKYGNQYHLVFPWADGGNLGDFWQNHFPNIHKKPLHYGLAKWIVGESLGIAQGLHLIHHPGPSSTTDECTEGRHGDIKPENILWFRGRGGNDRGMLKISDFGLTEYHRKASVSKVRADGIGQTPTYRPPECEILGGCVSPSYDTWSLGCVLLQFVTWYVEGWEGVDEFSKRRSEASPPRRVRDQDVAGDLFYALARPPTANTAVKKQFNRLRHHERCSDMFVEMLDFIESRLLLIDGKQRARSEELVKRFEEIYARCCENEAYGVSRTSPLVPGRKKRVRRLFRKLICDY